ncbi:MAG: histidine phosphatase family protein [Bacillota bacterium]|nr:histidine phosphatase family protein [Bacillota bacterium]
MKNKYAAVILAAGYSSRMKSFKPLLPVGEMTAVERSIEAAKGAGIKNIIVVTGHNRESMLQVLKKNGVPESYNESYAKGMFSSIKAGVSSAKKAFSEIKGVVLMPVDCPLISSKVISSVMQSADDDSFCVPVYEGKKGHPLLIPEKYFVEICDYDGPGGLKGVTDKYWDKMKRVPVEEEGCVLDMDTPEGYEEIKVFLEAGCTREPLHELAKGRRVYLIRHGETKQHDEKMFIGRYDVPLEDGAEKSVKEMAGKLEEAIGDGMQKDNPLKIYTSPLKRAVQTAEIISDVLGADELIIEEELQEISLGGWDGLPIREVKEMYPEEYERRGRDIFVFKNGNKAENFYDVQYRAVRALRRILDSDDSKDILIVTHSAVIRALENNLKGMKVDDLWEPIGKCDYRIAEL